jgi:Ran GTPase-activating protein (RanGAP) involved in mRNA processing and transport
MTMEHRKTVIHCPVHALPEFVPCDPAEVAPIADHLRSNTPVESETTFPRGTILPDGRLDLCKQSLGPEGCRLITDALADNTTVASLMLGTDAIGNAGAADVARLLERNERLEVVYLGCNRIDGNGVGLLADALAEHPSVTGLWLKRNPIGDDGARHLARLLRTNRTLTTLDIVNTDFGDDGFDAILDALIEDNRTVERLFLGGNGLTAAAADRFARLLVANPVLKGIFLNVNHLGDDGAAGLAPALASNRTLTQLGLASNGIGPRGAEALFGAIAGHPTLFDVDLGYSPSTAALGAVANAVGDDGARLAGEMLARNQALIRLNLRRNGITETGIEHFVTGLEPNRTLQQLILDWKLDARLETLLLRNRDGAVPLSRRLTRDVKLIQSVYR